MKNPFAKRKSDYDNYENYDSDFYRGNEQEEGVVDDAVYEGDKPQASAAPAAPKRPAPERTQSGSNMLKLYTPHESSDCQDIAGYLVKGYTVVMNIEELERAETVRLVDFLMGVLFVLGGELRRVTKTTLVLSPRSGEMSGGEEEEDEEDFDGDALN